MARSSIPMCLVVTTLAGLAIGAVAWGRTRVDQRGLWPEDWPKELIPLRTQSRTVQMLTGQTADEIYEIRFADRDVFERTWPILSGLLLPTGRITAYGVGSSVPREWGRTLTNQHPAVRIHVRLPRSSAKGLTLAVPEPVPVRPHAIDLVVDGEVIDPARIVIPEDALWVDIRNID